MTAAPILPADSEAALDRAARHLRAGGLVAFPTETVYGLAADAQRADAVARIFAAKGRPASHPLIVHLGAGARLSDWAAQPPAQAEALARAFWPGPLTLVLHRPERIPRATTGGLDTVALRVPAHPAARALLARFGGALAAPSANRFGTVSPTRAEHVADSLGSAAELILDGGPCPVGVESTIVDLTGGAPRLARPGAITRDDLEAALGSPVHDADGTLPVSGNLPSHYAPAARVELTSAESLPVALARHLAAGRRVAALAPAAPPVPDGASAALLVHLALPTDPEQAARRLYAALREADRHACDVVLCVPPAAHGIGAAVLDRLRKAAGPR